MKTSESIDKLAEALAAAQGEFTAAERDYTAKVATKKGGEYSFNYADLAAYLDVCRGPLSRNGLAVVQEPIADGQKARVTTMLMHKSGQYILFDPLELQIAFKEAGETPTPQEMGSAITYARRYSQSAALNMASEQDDDGNHASGNAAQTGRREPLPACPKCGKQKSVIPGKAEYGAGLLCWKGSTKEEGCGHKWETESYPFNDKHKKPADAKPETNGHAEEKLEPVEQLRKWLINIGCKDGLQATQVVIWASGGEIETIGDATANNEKAAQAMGCLNAKHYDAKIPWTAMLKTAAEYEANTKVLSRRTAP